MKLKVTAENRERKEVLLSAAGKGVPIPFYRQGLLVLCVLCSMLFVLYSIFFASQSYCDTPEDKVTFTSADLVIGNSSAGRSVSNPQNRPAIVDAIRPVYLPKETKLEIASDRPLRIKQMKLSTGGVLRIEIFDANTSLPDSITIDKGILRGVAFETHENELRIFVGLTEPVIYDVESTDQGLALVFQNPTLEQLISLNINDESISTVLLLLFMEYGANIVAGSDVTGRVTAHLVDVPLKAALSKILEAEGYGYVEEAGGLIRVLPLSELAKKEASEEALSPAVQKALMTETKLFELEFADAMDMQALVEKLVGKEGTLLADPRTNTLIVISIPEEIERIGGIIEQLDREVPEEAAPMGQVPGVGAPGVPEVEVLPEIVKKVFKLYYLSPETGKAVVTPFLSERGSVEVVKEEGQTGAGTTGRGGASSSMGIGGITGGAAGSGAQMGEAVGRGGYILVSDTQENLDKIEEELAKLDIPVPQVEIEAYIVEGTLSKDSDLGIDWAAVSKDDDMQVGFTRDFGGILTKGIISAEKFTGILNALSTNSELEVLSNPRITTLEDQPALFHSGDKVPYNRITIQEGIQQVETVFEDVGIVLAVTPQVKADDMVSLLLTTSVSSEGGFTPTGQPRIATRTTQSQVLVKSGDTAVIAGLISGKNSTTVSKVPLIGDIPLIGRVFSTERAVKQKSEVTIFITPRIIH